jgi:hypothetical protein
LVSGENRELDAFRLADLFGRSARAEGAGGMNFRLIEQDGEVVEFEARTGNIIITFIAAVRLEGDTVVLADLHVDGPGANTAGTGVLLRVARHLKEHFDVRELRVEGARRTTGAGPGRVPGPRNVRG